MRDSLVASATFTMDKLVAKDQPDPHATALLIARTHAANAFEKEYGAPPDWDRCVLDVQHSEWRTTVQITQFMREPTGELPVLPNIGSRSHRAKRRRARDD